MLRVSLVITATPSDLHLSCWLAACRVPIGGIRDPVDRSFLSAPLSLALHHNAKLCQANTLRINIKIGTFSLYSHIQLKVSQTSQQFRLPGGLAVGGMEPHIHFESTGRSPSHTHYYQWHYSPAPLCTSWEPMLLKLTVKPPPPAHARSTGSLWSDPSRQPDHSLLTACGLQIHLLSFLGEGRRRSESRWHNRA